MCDDCQLLQAQGQDLQQQLDAARRPSLQLASGIREAIAAILAELLGADAGDARAVENAIEALSQIVRNAARHVEACDVLL